MPTEDPSERIRSHERRLDVHGPEATFNEDGVDLNQIHESLDRAPLERLVQVQNWAISLAMVRVVRTGLEQPLTLGLELLHE